MDFSETFVRITCVSVELAAWILREGEEEKNGQLIEFWARGRMGAWSTHINGEPTLIVDKAGRNVPWHISIEL